MYSVTGFLWFIDSLIRKESSNLSLYGHIRAKEIPYSGYFWYRIAFIFVGTVSSCYSFSQCLHLILNQYTYGCWFDAELSWKKKNCFEKIFVFFTKYTLFAEKNIFIWKKSFILKFFLLKKTFFTKKNIYENIKNTYLIREIYFYTENVCVANKI